MPTAPTIAVIIVAAGRGERAGGPADLPKQYRQVSGRPVLARTIDAMLAIADVSAVLVVIHPDQRALYDALDLPDDPRLLPPTYGDVTRQGSVLAGLETLSANPPDLVLIQDAARPFTSLAVVRDVIDKLAILDGAIAAVPVTDTIKRAINRMVIDGTEDRSVLFGAQTPQGFRFGAILDAHRRASALPQSFTDDAAIGEWAGLRVGLAQGDVANFKITHPEDFARAERMLEGKIAMETRIGNGFDVHPFDEGDAVWLGGVEIPHTHKLQGHSDADVALHALADALYGALGEGDIGTHFPPSDPQWRGAASTIFVSHAAELVRARQGRIVNLDLTIVCEAPRISPHVGAMREAIGLACGISSKRVAIKATTSEKLGFTGRREGIVAMATASVELPREEDS